MAQLCEPRRGRALLALLASLLLSGAQAASRDLDVYGEGQAGDPGAGARGGRSEGGVLSAQRDRRLLGGGEDGRWSQTCRWRARRFGAPRARRRKGEQSVPSRRKEEGRETRCIDLGRRGAGSG